MAGERDQAVDVARGLACLLMIQTHAFDGWASAEARGTVAFAVTRWLGAFPLPTFLLLAGVAVVLRRQAAAARGQSAGMVRWQIAMRGLSLVGWGYANGLLWGLVEGAGWRTLLRSDVLQAIGVSLLLAAWVLGTQRPWRRAALGAALMVALCPWLTRLGHGLGSVLEGGFGVVLAPGLALVLETPGWGHMPAVPLAAFCLAGVALASWVTPPGLARPRFQLLTDWRRTTAWGAGLWLAGWLGTAALGAWWSLPLSRAEVSVWPNAIEGLGRALWLLGLAMLLVQRAPAALVSWLSRLGAASLAVYLVHLPLCYGRLSLFRGRLTVVEATPAVLALCLATYAAVLALSRLKARRPGAAALRNSA